MNVLFIGEMPGGERRRCSRRPETATPVMDRPQQDDHRNSALPGRGRERRRRHLGRPLAAQLMGDVLIKRLQASAGLTFLARMTLPGTKLSVLALVPDVRHGRPRRLITRGRGGHRARAVRPYRRPSRSEARPTRDWLRQAAIAASGRLKRRSCRSARRPAGGRPRHSWKYSPPMSRTGIVARRRQWAASTVAKKPKLVTPVHPRVEHLPHPPSAQERGDMAIDRVTLGLHRAALEALKCFRRSSPSTPPRRFGQFSPGPR